MNISFTGRHIEVTDALRTFATERLERLAKHFDRIMDVHLVLSVDKVLQKAEATLEIPHFPTIHAHAESTDMYNSIDTMIGKLESQIQKHKEKKITERDHGNHAEENA